MLINKIKLHNKIYIEKPFKVKNSCEGCSFTHNTRLCFNILTQIQGTCAGIWRPQDIVKILNQL